MKHFVKIDHAVVKGREETPCLVVKVIREVGATRRKPPSKEVVWSSEPHITLGGLNWGPKFDKQLSIAVNMAASLNERNERKKI